jgi:hypothetical protein
VGGFLRAAVATLSALLLASLTAARYEQLDQQYRDYMKAVAGGRLPSSGSVPIPE